MKRPLYLAGAARSVELDGPALRILVEGRADGRVPLRLLSRVVVRGRVAWSSAALGACFAAGVPLVFLQSDGRPLGYRLPAVQSEERLGTRLDRLEEEPDGIARFGDWTRAEERRALLACRLLFQGGELLDLRPQRCRALVLSRLDPSPERAEALWQALEGLLAGHLSELLLAAGLGPRHAAPAPPGRVDLFGACLAAGSWKLVPSLQRLCAHRRAHPEAWRGPERRRRRLARHYDATAPAVAADLRRRLHRLELWCQERER